MLSGSEPQPLRAQEKEVSVADIGKEKKIIEVLPAKEPAAPARRPAPAPERVPEKAPEKTPA